MLKVVTKDFNLDYSLDSGQAFRFNKAGKIQRGVLGNVVLDIRQDQNVLFVDCHPKVKKDTLGRLKYYFNLDIDLGKILSKIDTDSYINKAISRFWGLRIINQDVWECLASYIISQRKRIPSIKKNIEFFSKTFGRHIWEDCFSFPKPEDVLCKCQDLRHCRLGYREPYILKAVSKILDEKIDLESLKSLRTAVARERLIEFYGVGEKVADCVMLYSLKKYDVFPIDVWIRRVMIRRYIKKEVKDPYIREFALDKWKEYAGFAQVYLFYYSRLMDKELK